MPPVTRVPSVVPPGAAAVLAALDAGAACRPADLARVRYLLATAATRWSSKPGRPVSP